MRRSLLLLAAVLSVCTALDARAQKLDQRGVALVIGNDRYPNWELGKSVNGARAVGEALQKIGFTVIRGENLDRHAMFDRVFDFAQRIKPGDTALIYFAGRGVAIDSGNQFVHDTLRTMPHDRRAAAIARSTFDNYLLPINSPPIDVRRALPAELQQWKADIISVSDIVENIQRRGPKATVLVFDACCLLMRNPWPNVFVVHSAGSGEAVLESLGPQDQSPYSVFTRVLLTRLMSPDTLMEIFSDVRLRVGNLSTSWQVPVFCCETSAHHRLRPVMDSARPVSSTPTMQNIVRLDKEPSGVASPSAPSAPSAATPPPAERPLPSNPPPPAASTIGPPAGIGRPTVIAPTVTRYPTIEAPERAVIGRRATVLVSLTVAPITPDVKPGPTGKGVTPAPSGGIRIPKDRLRIPLTVILTAPGFDSPPEATIELDEAGDSTVARFDITAQPGKAGARSLRVSFWRDGEFLASASRKIEIVKEQPVSAKATSAKSRQLVKQDNAVSVDHDRRAIDLTVEMVYDDPRSFSGGNIIVVSRYLGRPLRGRFEAAPDLAKWIEGFYREFRNDSMRTDAVDPAAAAIERETRLARLRGFGDELFRRAAPPVLKDSLRTLLSDKTVTLRTVQIYSNNPLIPWELMRAPKPVGGSTDFFGIEFALARWHEDDDRATVRPPHYQRVEEVVAIAPSYAEPYTLDATAREVKKIEALLRTRHMPGQRSSVLRLIRQPPNGIVHFAGHGEIAGETAVERRFAIRLEDGLLDVMQWRGVAVASTRSRALYFFNACDIGQAESMAGVVEGWGPAVLAKGASGYIGGLWPLRDEPATRFAVAFYQAISESLNRHSRASVADALRQARALVNQSGDATFLAYAFYGDAQLEFGRQ